MGYRKIAQWLNENGYTTPRGHEFKNTHVFSIFKKKKLRDKRLLPCYAALCYAMLGHAVICYAALCYAVLCCAMLCYDVL